MAHTEEILVHGVMTPVTVFDSTAQEIDDAAQSAKYGGGRNLLDNWYFADPIDQRQGYVAPPATPYYSDTGLATQAGTVSAYTTAVNVNGAYGSITVSGATYYVPWSAAVRGYTGAAAYSIDRWRSYSGSTMLLEDDGIHVISDATGTDAYLIASFMEDPQAFAGKQVTASVFIKSLSGTISLHLFDGANLGIIRVTSPGVYSTTATVRDGASQLRFVIARTSGTAEVDCELKAVKLEFGDRQTLAHQDADGSWVLNDPPPNKALELAKCQRYQVPVRENSGIIFGNVEADGTLSLDFPLPVTPRANGVLEGDWNVVCVTDDGAAAPVFIPSGTQLLANPSGVRMSRIAVGVTEWNSRRLVKAFATTKTMLNFNL